MNIFHVIMNYTSINYTPGEIRNIAEGRYLIADFDHTEFKIKINALYAYCYKKKIIKLFWGNIEFHYWKEFEKHIIFRTHTLNRREYYFADQKILNLFLSHELGVAEWRTK